MHGTTLRITAAALGLAALATAPTSGALADAKKDGYGYSSQVCYKVGSGYDRLVLNIKPESSLNFQGGYPQVVWTAEGKYVSVYGNYPDMAVADGAVVTTKSSYQSYGNYYKGAHLGVDVPGTNYAFNCTSPTRARRRADGPARTVAR